MRRLYRIFSTRHIAAFPVWLAVLVLFTGQIFRPGGVAAASPVQVRELNFVFIHGMNVTSAATQLLADTIEEQAQTYISAYEQANPGTTIRINTLQRSYPNNVDIDTWANNIADGIKKHFAGKKDLILVGYSAGGKAALRAVAQNIGNLSDLAAMVVTINSPIKRLKDYYVVGGGSVTDYIRVSRLISDKGIADSLGSYDSSADGLQVGTSKHWLAFVSAESAPLSPQYDFSGVDSFPEDMDDGLVPISAQYSAGADVVYYGEQAHGAFSDKADVAGIIAEQILRYLFGGTMKTPVLVSTGTFEHHAGWLPFTYRWYDRLGEVSGPNGIITHTNNSLFKWQEWEDTVGEYAQGYLHSSYQVHLSSPPLLTTVQARWLNPGDPTDSRLSLKTRAAPKSSVRVRWDIRQHQSLPPGVNRDYYEIKVTGVTSMVKVLRASWLMNNPSDTRVQVWSQAEGPFRWFKAEVKVYHEQAIQRKVIDEIFPPDLTAGNE